ncbi:thermosome subunit [Candidatus Woesearchaeota archaeon]|nr:thermosome subunit [Candidatus Woesearchaeota archaeon]MBT4321820.1 thermosome subunit [Candidatus Woesearchaeota archaeon]
MADDKQPVYILSEGNQRTYGKEAQRNNIMAAKLVAETVRSTLGPKGMDKMLVDSMGDVVITNDGVTILEEMQIEHPAAKMIVEIAKTQEDEVGDGTTSAVVFAGELLKNAESLLEKNIHPTIVAKGFRLAESKAQEILNEIAEDVSLDNEDILEKIAMTAMTGKGAEASKEKLAKLAVGAVKQVLDDNIDLNNIKVEKKVGGGVENSELIQGIVLDKEKLHSSMPSKINDAKIALISVPLEIKDTEIDAKIQITSPEQMQSFIEQEENMLRSMAQKVIDSGANVLISQKGIDDLAQHYLAKAGVYAVRRVKQSDMEKLIRATGGKIVSNLKDLSESDLGKSGLVEEVKIGDEEFTYVTNCENPKAVTFLVRGGTEHVVDEVERAIQDALGDLAAALKNGKVVGGAGAPEIELSKRLREFANTLSGREQLAVLAFAESMEAIPITLAENAGIDPIDILTELKARHDSGDKWAGIDVFSGKVVDSWSAGVIEPLKIKTQAIKSAAEVSEMILRIDDVIASGKGSGQAPMQPPMGYE